MMIRFFEPRDDQPDEVVAEAELVFDDGDSRTLRGLTLVGFAVRMNEKREEFVTLPARAFGAGAKRAYYYYLRGENEAVTRFKTVVLNAYHDWRDHRAKRQA